MMKEELIKLLDKAYAPYSKFHVGAIIETKDAKYIPGVNVENASYGATICAERNAITTAISMGYKKGDFKELHCLCKDSNRISTSCFGCRQVIQEFFDKNDSLYFYSNNGLKKEYKVSELCPYPFNEEDLK